MESGKQWLEAFPRKYIPQELVFKQWGDIEKYFNELSERELKTVRDMEQWLFDWSEARSVVEEYSSRAYVEMTCHTDDESCKNAYLECVRNIDPKLMEWENKRDHKYYQTPIRGKLNAYLFSQFDRMKKAHIELYTEKNLPLEVRLRELSQKYQELIGGMTVNFDGEERTMPQMAQYLKQQDRDLRERAYMAATRRRLEEKDRLDDIFDEMLKVRAEFAANLGLESYMDYCFRSKLRDYTPEDCLKFHKSIENTAVVLSRKLMKARKEALKLDSLKPWDLDCDIKGRAPLKPFDTPDELSGKVSQIFEKLDPRLGERFESIRFSMDLDSRKGKAPGGYQTTFAEARLPFIFTNAVGSQNNVNTLLHEGGHAFHTLESRTQPLMWYRHAPMEFSEVASMSCELLGGRTLDPFYPDEENRRRARLEHLKGVAGLFGWVALVDAFQHWLYTSPGHSREERNAKWVELYERFGGGGVDWAGAPEGALEFLWHRQLHIFEVPFYYIEYAIAQLGALQIYENYMKMSRLESEVASAVSGCGAHLSQDARDHLDPRQVIDSYLFALSEGGSRSAPVLFQSAGISFDFGAELLGRLMEMVEEEIDELG